MIVISMEWKIYEVLPSYSILIIKQIRDMCISYPHPMSGMDISTTTYYLGDMFISLSKSFLPCNVARASNSVISFLFKHGVCCSGKNKMRIRYKKSAPIWTSWEGSKGCALPYLLTTIYVHFISVLMWVACNCIGNLVWNWALGRTESFRDLHGDIYVFGTVSDGHILVC